jgi:HprK-related kinase A
LTEFAAATVGDLGADVFVRRLARGGIGVRIGPFALKLRASSAGLAGPLHELYRPYPLLADTGIFHAHVGVRDVRRWLPRSRRGVRFEVDGRAPHEDLPFGQSLPALEWGINLVIALRYHCFLMFHAAALERGGAGLLMPALPGHGKTTLCAALAHRDFRLLSDEFGLLRPGSTELVPVPRPMPLKNASIGVIRDFARDAFIGPVIPGTRKGTLAHVRPPFASVLRMSEPAPVRWVVFPRWEEGAALCLEALPRTEAFMLLAGNAFNYELLGEQGFDTVGRLAEQSGCLRLTYSRLEDAVGALTRLVDGHD